MTFEEFWRVFVSDMGYTMDDVWFMSMEEYNHLKRMAQEAYKNEII